MARILPIVLVLAACAGKDTPQSICEDTVEVYQGCLSGPYAYYYGYPYGYSYTSYTPYTVTQDVEACEESLEACTEGDLATLDAYLGCLYDTCDSVACDPILDTVGIECLPDTYTPGTTPSAIRAMDVHSSESP